MLPRLIHDHGYTREATTFVFELDESFTYDGGESPEASPTRFGDPSMHIGVHAASRSIMFHQDVPQTGQSAHRKLCVALRRLGVPGTAISVAESFDRFHAESMGCIVVNMPTMPIDTIVECDDLSDYVGSDSESEELEVAAPVLEDASDGEDSGDAEFPVFEGEPFPELPDPATMPEDYEPSDFYTLADSAELTPNFAAMTRDNLMAYGTRETVKHGKYKGRTFHSVGVDDWGYCEGLARKTDNHDWLQQDLEYCGRWYRAWVAHDAKVREVDVGEPVSDEPVSEELEVVAPVSTEPVVASAADIPTSVPESSDDFLDFAAMPYDTLMAYGTRATMTHGKCAGWTFHRVGVDYDAYGSW